MAGNFDEEMVMRFSENESLEGLPHSDMEGGSSGLDVSDLSSKRNRICSGVTFDLQAAAKAYYGGKQTGDKNKNKNVKK